MHALAVIVVRRIIQISSSLVFLIATARPNPYLLSIHLKNTLNLSLSSGWDFLIFYFARSNQRGLKMLLLDYNTIFLFSYLSSGIKPPFKTPGINPSIAIAPQVFSETRFFASLFSETRFFASLFSETRFFTPLFSETRFFAPLFSETRFF
jgi:hypothetical protein